ncbi:MAG: (2Fe-2S)-binding protein [Burkholderiales bacterium]|nr:(2Fe-2S)-binding protein [Burkholderiales bacterium]
MTKVSMTVNGRPVALELEDRTLLADALRDALGLTGTHVGCDTSQCGCCTVHLDGRPVKSCTMLAAQADGRAVVTIEGLAGSEGPTGGDALHPVQQAFTECHALQCGFCTPGMIMAAAGLLAENPAPTEDEIVHALEGNLCRCTGYVNIVSAVKRAAGLMRG